MAPGPLVFEALRHHLITRGHLCPALHSSGQQLYRYDSSRARAYNPFVNRLLVDQRERPVVSGRISTSGGQWSAAAG